GYLDHAEPEIRRFLEGRHRIAFVPFALHNHAAYTDKVRERLGRMGFEVTQVRGLADLNGADAIFVGGGNTFRLLDRLCRFGLLDPIRQRVRAGVPYLGVSAGTNVACPTIKTTNDMPIVDPGGFDALALIPLQINPHYLNVALPGHHGETRDQRLAEFARVNPALPVIGLPEGDWLRVSGATIELRGPHPAAWFEGNAPPARLAPGWRFKGSA
ncbi:MAG: dipeptidase PepE, partial [Burkholderiales bacterium]